MENTEELQNRKLKITVSGAAGAGKTTLLNIIRGCLERDYVFRTLFAGAEIMVDEKVEELPDRVEVEKTENNI
jgi:ABC-type lipoprotein export system ATPase subunit